LRGKGRFSLWRFFWRFCLSVSLLLILWVGFLFVWYAKDLPDPGKLTERQVKQSTKIYDRTGTTILYEIGEIKPYLGAAKRIARPHQASHHRGRR
jgi:membrane carboxypeptidase/penicillin-binding protein